MKRLLTLLVILAGLAIAAHVEARLVDFYASQGLELPAVSERAPLAAQCGIPGNYVGSYDQNLILEGCLNGIAGGGVAEGMVGAAAPEDNYDTYLTAPIGITDATIYVNKIPTVVTESVYTIFASDGRTVSEKVYCTSTTSTPSKALTGCTRGISATPSAAGVITETAGTGVSHSQNSRIAITDNINFSGKALSILIGNQSTGATSFIIGSATTSGWKFDSSFRKIYAFNNGTNPYIGFNTSTGKWQWSEDGTNYSNFTSSTISQLSASSTLGTSLTGSELGVIVSSSRGMYNGADGQGIYQKTNATGGLLCDTNGCRIDPTSSTVWSGNNTSTGATAFTGTVNVTGTSTLATTTVNGINIYTGIGLFGDGSDGDVSTTTNATSSRDMYFNNLTIGAGIVWKTNGFKIFVKGTLTNNGTIDASGSNGASALLNVGGNGGATVASGTIFGGFAGGKGGDGTNTTAAGSNGATGITYNPVSGVAGSAGGTGGDSGAGEAGGTAGAAGTKTNAITNLRDYWTFNSLLQQINGTQTMISANTGSGGGSGAGGDAGAGAGTSGGGGGAGGSGGIVWIIARIITNNGTISANGGNGGNGADAVGALYKGGGGGGGAGGSGGKIMLMYNTITTGTIQTNAGTAGSGGAATNGGTVGTAGTAGTAGTTISIQIN